MEISKLHFYNNNNQKFNKKIIDLVLNIFYLATFKRWIQDIGTTSGTCINIRKIKWAKL